MGSFSTGGAKMAGKRIAYYHRRLKEERRAAAIADTAAVAQIHEDFARHYEERLMLERFGVNTAAELPSAFSVMARSQLFAAR